MRKTFLLRLSPAVLSLGLISFVPVASAQSVDTHQHGTSLDARQHGYEHGYREGYHHGQEDMAAKAAPDFHSKDYKRGDVGYDAYMGSHDQYKKGFREGYESGYKDGFTGNNTRLATVFGVENDDSNVVSPNVVASGDDASAMPQADSNLSGGYMRDHAYDVGYNDGIRAGAKARDGGHSYNPEDNDQFKDADHGYHSNLGSKDDFKKNYREGFARGYHDGFGPQR